MTNVFIISFRFDYKYFLKNEVWKTFFWDLFLLNSLVPTYATHAVTKEKGELRTGLYKKVEVSRPDVPEETHFKGSQLQLII